MPIPFSISVAFDTFMIKNTQNTVNKLLREKKYSWSWVPDLISIIPRATDDTPAKRLSCDKCGTTVDGAQGAEQTQKGCHFY